MHGSVSIVYHIKVCFFGNEEHEKVKGIFARMEALENSDWICVHAYWLLSRKEVYPFRPQRGLPFAAVKRLALCLGADGCRWRAGRELPCLALRTTFRSCSLRKRRACGSMI